MTSRLPTKLQDVLSSATTGQEAADKDSNNQGASTGHQHRNARASKFHPQEGIHSKSLDDFLANQMDTTLEGRERLASMFPEETHLGW